MATVKTLAQYVLALEQCARSTKRTEDRRLYEALLADSAGILAAVVTSQSKAAIAAHVAEHERLWGQTWFQDQIYRDASDAWRHAKNALDRAAA